MNKNSNIDGLIGLRNQLDQSFNETELRDLCFELGMEYENLRGHTKTEKARELVTYCQRNNQLSILVEKLKIKRPNTSWNFDLSEASTPQPETTSANVNTKSNLVKPALIIGVLLVLVITAYGITSMMNRENGTSNKLERNGEIVETAESENFEEELAAITIESPRTNEDEEPSESSTSINQAAEEPTEEVQILTPTEPAFTATPVPTIPPSLPPTPTPFPFLEGANLTANPGKSDNPRLLFDKEGILHFVWSDLSTGKPLGDFLYRQRSPEGEWSDTQILSNDFELISDSRIHLQSDPSDNICVFFEGTLVQTNPETIGLHSRCLNNKEWSNSEQLRGFLPVMWQSREFQPVFDQEGVIKTVFLAGVHNAYYEDIQLSDDFKNATNPAFAIDTNGGYHAVWVRQGQPFSIEYRYSQDNGLSWQDAERLTEDAGTGTVGPLQLLSDKTGNIHLVFSSPQHKGIFYRRWSQEAGWEPAIELTQGQPTNGSTSLGVTIDSQGHIHVLWQSIFGVYYAEQISEDQWEKPIQISDAHNSGPGPAIAVDEQGVRHFVWQVEDDAIDLYYATLP